MKNTGCIVAAESPSPLFTPVTIGDPAGQVYLDGIRAVTVQYCATMAPSPSSEMPILKDKVMAYAIATEKLLRAPDSGKKLRRALAAVETAEADLFAVIDHLRAAARELGWHDAQRGVRPPAPVSIALPVATTALLRSIEDLADGMAAA